MCNLYASLSGPAAIRALFPQEDLADRLGNAEPLPEIWPNGLAPVLRREGAGLVLARARWGLPTPPAALKGQVDRGVTNVRNTASGWWRRWLGPEHRCLVPFDRFAEPDPAGGQAWFAPREAPAVFAGIFLEGWTSVRRRADGATTDDLFAFLTCAPNAEVAAVHPKAMPVILTTAQERAHWLGAPWAQAAQLQRPLPDGALQRIAPARD